MRPCRRSFPAGGRGLSRTPSTPPPQKTNAPKSLLENTKVGGHKLDTALRMPANNFATCGRNHFCSKLFVMVCLNLEPLRCCATHGAADRGDGWWGHNILTRRLQAVRTIASARLHAMFLLVNTIHEAREIRAPNLLIWSQTRCHCAIAPVGTMVHQSRTHLLKGRE